MIHYNYRGQVALKTADPDDQVFVKSAENDWEDFLIDNLWISNSNLVKFKSNQYLLLIDGVIYDFDHALFSEKNYSFLIDQFALNGEGALRKLNGEFVLTIMDLLSNEIWFVTSETGSTAFFYREVGNYFHFSNSIKELLQIPNESNKIHFQRIYDILTGNNLGSESTCFTAIKRLMPGQYLKLEDGSSSVVDYSLLYDKERLRKHLPDPYGRFRDVFAHAVNSRLLSERIGIALSSGKDSTAVTAMANFVGSSSNHKLVGYCYKPTFLSEEHLTDHRYNETILLESFYKDYPQILSKEVEVKSGTVLSSLENSIKIYGEPVYGAANQIWIQKMQQMVAEDQCGTMLNGQLGNFTISWPPPEMLNLKRSILQKIYGRLISKHKGYFHRPLPYISKDFILNINKGSILDPSRRMRLDLLQPMLIRNSVAYSGYLQKQVSLHYGYHLTDPTADKNIIDFCLSIPFDIYHNKESSRNLVVEGLKDLLPEKIRSNQIRGIQGSDIKMRIHQEKDLIYDKLMLLNKNKLTTFVLDIDSLVKEWKHFDILSMNYRDLRHILRIIQMGIFLSEIED